MKATFNILFFSFAIFLTACKKLVNVSDPVNSITTSQVFTSEGNAVSAVAAIYSSMINTSYYLGYASGGTTLYAGLSSDELKFFFDYNPYITQFQNNSLLPNNTPINDLWKSAYTTIYQANSVVEGLQASSSIPTVTKNQLLGEAKFLRSLANFYLINLFGDIPRINTTDWNQTDTVTRRPVQDIYQQITADLKDASQLMVSDDTYSPGERIRANKWSAVALLARTYLYQQKWDSAEAQASAVINDSALYTLSQDLNNVFLKNSNETILQLQISGDVWPYATPEGNTIIPYDNTSNPSYYLTNSFLASFEPGDQRRIDWVNSTTYASDGNTYYYPFKYKVNVGSGVTEYYMVLRLAEQYLIRAEARARQTNFSGAQSDINRIRNRAHLSNTTANNQEELLSEILHERQIELFSEWGHRWLDLKRIGQATQVLTTTKGIAVSTDALLYPIPQFEIQRNVRLSQNSGY
jgi:hypothetical protein